MSGVFGEWGLEERAAEAGRTAGEQRRYEAAYAETEARMRAVMSAPRPTTAPEPEVRQLVAPVPVHATGPRARWLRDTWGGRVAQMFPAPDEAAEMAAAKAEADQHELTYGSRQPLAQFLHKVRGSGRGTGPVLSGETADVIGQIRLVNPDQPIRMVVGPDPASAHVGGVVTAPGRGPEAAGDPGLAAATLQQLARRQ